MCRCHGLNLLPALVGPADAAAAARLNDGRGEYSLVGFISHMGANTACGHYVAHIRKEGRWVIYNDEKVLTESGFSRVRCCLNACAICRCTWRAGGRIRLMRRQDLVRAWHARATLPVEPSDKLYAPLAQVAASAKPPKALGYLYLYMRNDC